MTSIIAMKADEQRNGVSFDFAPSFLAAFEEARAEALRELAQAGADEDVED